VAGLSHYTVRCPGGLLTEPVDMKNPFFENRSLAEEGIYGEIRMEFP